MIKGRILNIGNSPFAKGAGGLNEIFHREMIKQNL